MSNEIDVTAFLYDCEEVRDFHAFGRLRPGQVIEAEANPDESRFSALTAAEADKARAAFEKKHKTADPGVPAPSATVAPEAPGVPAPSVTVAPEAPAPGGSSRSN